MPDIDEEHNNLLTRLAFRLVKKHIAGSTLSSVLDEVRKCNTNGMQTTITFLNDQVDDQSKARYNANAYVQLAKQASRLRLGANLSLRLTQIGYRFNEGTPEKYLDEIMSVVEDGDSKLWLEAENTIDMQRLFEFYRNARKGYKNIGMEIPIWYPLEVEEIKKNLKPNDSVKLTSYVYTNMPKTGNGIQEKEGKKKEKKSKKIKKDKSMSRHEFEYYLSHISKLLQAGVSVYVLDTDEKMVAKLANFSKEYKKNLIFELPLGFNKKWTAKLSKMKVRLSIYTPYGKDWSPYILNKLKVGGHIKDSIAAKVLKRGGN